MLMQRWTSQQIDMMTAGASAIVLSTPAPLTDPCHNWRGFFVGYFYFGFFGYRQLPARAGAPRMPA